MNDEDLGLVRRISRDQAKEWGIPHQHTMNPQPVCKTCRGPVDWVDSPSGAWWSHWNHPLDGHDAEVELAPYGRAFFISAEHIESKRFQEEWSLVFLDPDLQDAWEVAYFVGNADGEADEWNDARDVLLTRVRRVEVVKNEWHPVRNLVSESTPRP
jgi:hypothetical protein